MHQFARFTVGKNSLMSTNLNLGVFWPVKDIIQNNTLEIF